MSKQEWQKHEQEVGPHDHGACAICALRRATKNALRRRRERDDAYRSCGLVKVRGALGGIYWE